jgi:hypothetical protein
MCSTATGKRQGRDPRDERRPQKVSDRESGNEFDQRPADGRLSFNDALRAVSIDPSRVRLARHQDARGFRFRSLYAAWISAGGEALVEEYQRVQSKPRFDRVDYVASFVVTPAPGNETVFIGLYRVKGRSTCPPGMRDVYTDTDVGGLYWYDLERDGRLDLYRDRLVIDWGPGALAWCQRAETNRKPIRAIRDALPTPFPGAGEFTADIDSIAGLPPSWREYLQNTKGVYLLVDKDDGKAYVGSAKGGDSFWGRWIGYSQNRHGGNVGMKARPGRHYQVSILQVVDIEQSDQTIEQLEARWKRKLLSRSPLGLNLN